MWFFYIYPLVFILIGCILWYKNKEIDWREWLLGSGIAYVFAIIFNLIALSSIHFKTRDIETWSGYITQVEHHPKWVERWRKRHSETYYTGTGENRTAHTRVWYTTEYDTHPEHWEAARFFGQLEDKINIDQDLYNQIKSFFGNSIVNGGKQNTHHGGHFDSGDNNVYVTPNETGFIYPAIITKSFKNRIKATPNIFQFAKIPTNVTVYPYPHNGCWNESDRLFGTAAILINKFKFDQFNASLGPLKKVNVIMIGFGGKDAMYGQYQEAAYIGGKKNDLVICYGGGSKQESAQWAYVFSWSEKDIVKRNIETILLNNPINDDILPLIGNEIKKNYIKKEWKKFDYISISPPVWVYLVYVLLTTLTQIGLYIYFHFNEVFYRYRW